MGDALNSQARTLIQGFRETFSKFTKTEQNSIRKHSDALFAPSQMVILRSKHPRIECVIVSHLEDEPDMEIHSYESSTYDELFRLIETKVLNDRICLRIGRVEVEEALAIVINSARQYNIINLPRENGMLAGRSVMAESPSYVFLSAGSILDLDARKEGAKIANNARIHELIPAWTAKLPKEKVTPDGLGTRLDPEIWIGSESELSFAEKAFGPSPSGAHTIEFKTSYKDVPLVISRGGYFAVGTKDKAKALPLLNEIAAALMIVSNLPVSIIREYDLGEARFADRSSSTSGGKNSTSSHPILVSRETIERAIAFARRLENNPRLTAALVLALEAQTHWKYSEWAQALITSWIFLEEIYIDDAWKQFIRTKTVVPKPRLDKLENYNVDWKLEALNLSGKLSDERYSELMKIKTERNHVVHTGANPRKEIVGRSVILMVNFIRDYSLD